MRTQKKCLGIDIGSHSIKIIEAVKAKDHVRVVRMVTRELDMDPAATPEERSKSLSVTVKDVIKAEKFSTKDAVFAIPGQNIFVRRLKVPRTTEDRLKLIIAFEAREQIPFPIDKTRYESQIFDEGEDELEVVLVAVKRDIVEQYMDTFRGLGVKPLYVAVSTLALYNFHVFNEEGAKFFVVPETEKKDKKAKKKFSLKFGKKKKVEEEEIPEEEASGDVDAVVETEFVVEEITGFIDLGAMTTDICVDRKGAIHMLGFTRSIPIAGNMLMRGLKDAIGSDDEQKLSKLLFSKTLLELESDENPETDERLVKAKEAVTKVIDRLVNEIRRSLDFYISQPDGMPVDRIVLTGGLSKLPNLQQYFEEKLSIPVEIENTITTSALKLPEEISEDISAYVGAIGMALSGLGYGNIEADFLPPDMKDFREFKRKNVEVIVAGALCALMILFSRGIGEHSIRQYDSMVSTYQGKIAKARETIGRANNAEESRGNVSKKIDSFQKMLLERDTCLDAMVKIKEFLPPNVWFNRIVLTSSGRGCRIYCNAYSMGSISTFVKNLRQPGSIFQDPRIADQVPEDAWHYMAASDKVQAFVITFTLANKTSSLGDRDWDAYLTEQLAKAAAPMMEEDDYEDDY